MLILQAEHGGGNNSTFTVRVTSSTGTDTYSTIAAGIGSLKGPLHGGANIQVADMFQHLKENIKDWTSVDEIDTYYTRMLNKEVYNKTGLIYGIGHAVYTISDPRALLLKELARDLAREKAEKANLLSSNCWKNVPSLLSDGLKTTERQCPAISISIRASCMK